MGVAKSSLPRFLVFGFLIGALTSVLLAMGIGTDLYHYELVPIASGMALTLLPNKSSLERIDLATIGMAGSTAGWLFTILILQKAFNFV